MKILICTGIYPPDIGGPATYSKLLFKEFPKRGIGVEVLSFSAVRMYPKIFRHFLYFLKVLKQGKKVDLIYAQDPVSVGMPSCLASKILGKKFILKIVGDYAWEQFQNQKSTKQNKVNSVVSKIKKNRDSEGTSVVTEIKNQDLTQEEKFITPEEFQNKKFDFMTEVRRKIERRVAKKADKVVVPSKYLKKIVMMWGVSEDKIKVIYNAFTPKEILETKEELRRQFSFDNLNTDLQGNQKKNIFTSGRLVPWKGFKMLIEIMKDLPGFNLLIAGDGPDRERLEKKIKDLNLVGRVKLLGSLEQVDLLKRIKASDIFVLNTGYEGLSHQLLEVMSLGTPIITTNIGGNPEVIENGKDGILVGYNDKEKIRKAILFIENNPALSEDLAKNAKEKLKIFDRGKMLSEITEMLEGIVG